MTIPLAILAAAALLTGLFPGGLAGYLGEIAQSVL